MASELRVKVISETNHPEADFTICGMGRIHKWWNVEHDEDEVSMHLVYSDELSNDGYLVHIEGDLDNPQTCKLAINLCDDFYGQMYWVDIVQELQKKLWDAFLVQPDGSVNTEASMVLWLEIGDGEAEEDEEVEKVDISDVVTKLDNMQSELDGIESSLESIKSSLSDAEDCLSSVETEANEASTKLSNIEGEVSDLSKASDNVRAQINDLRDRF